MSSRKRRRGREPAETNLGFLDGGRGIIIFAFGTPPFRRLGSTGRRSRRVGFLGIPAKPTREDVVPSSGRRGGRGGPASAQDPFPPCGRDVGRVRGPAGTEINRPSPGSGACGGGGGGERAG